MKNDTVAISIKSIHSELHERFHTMRHREELSYRCHDYLHTQTQTQKQTLVSNNVTDDYEVTIDISNRKNKTCCASSYSTNSDFVDVEQVFDCVLFSSPNSSRRSMGINEAWRETICEWSYQVVDHFHYSRDIVSIALNYLDRFLSRTRSVNMKIFQLAALSSLYLAIKLYTDNNSLKIQSIIELSCGYFTADHVVAMEELLLRVLTWNIHPPTACTYLRYFMPLLPKGLCSETCNRIKDISRYLIELSVCDYYFVTRGYSSIALAAILNAFEKLGTSIVANKVLVDFLKTVNEVTGIDPDSDEVKECRSRLADMFDQGITDSARSLVCSSDDQSSNRCHGSPVCVTDPCVYNGQEDVERSSKSSKIEGKSYSERNLFPEL